MNVAILFRQVNTSQDFLCSGVINLDASHRGAKPFRSHALRRGRCPMDHKRSKATRHSVARAQISDNPGRGDGPDIVKGDRNGKRPKQIVQRDPIGDCASAGLESQMAVGNTVAARNSRPVCDPCNCGLVNRPGEYAVDFIVRLSRRGYGTIGYVVASIPKTYASNVFESWV